MLQVASYQIPKTGEWTFVGTLYLVCLVNGLLVIVVAILVTSLVTVQPQDPLAEAYLLDMFRRQDRNDSGFLDPNDTRRLLHDIGLPNAQVAKAMARLDFDQDGQLSRRAWLRVADFLMFDHESHRAISRYHNRLTAALIRWGLRKDRQDRNKVEWQQQTVLRDLALLTSQSMAQAAWDMMVRQVVHVCMCVCV